MINNPELPLVLVKLVLGFFAAFFAIIVWSKTRELPWLFLVAALLVQYLGVLFDALVMVGLVSRDVSWMGLSLWGLLFQGVPYLFFSASFIAFLVHYRRF